jgi:HK97 family phage major capsid protein
MEMKDFLSALDSKMEAYKTGLSTENQKALDGIKAEIKAAFDKAEEAKTSAAELKTALDKLEEKADKILAKAGRPGSGASVKTFEGELNEKLAEKSELLKSARQSKKGFAIELESKVVGNMGSSANLTGTYFVPPTVVPGVVPFPYESVHVRDLFPKGTTNSNVVRYIRDNNGEGGPATVAEGALKPQEDRDFAILDAPVRKIATYFRIPEEMIEDIDFLSSYLSGIGTQEVMAVEDAQLLYGDGTGQNLTGLNVAGTAFAAGTSVIGASANQFDVLGAAKKQLRNAKFGGPLVALINPTDYFDMRWRKDTANNYIFQSNQGLTPLQIDGITILEHTAVTAGGFFVISPSAAQVFDRKGLTVRLYDQDQDNAIRNMWTMVIEKRLAFPVYQPGAIIRGTFTAGITDLTS